MKKMFGQARRWIQRPEVLAPFHGWSAMAWFIAAFPICIWLNQSVPFLVFISVYAIVVSHWEGWQTAAGHRRENKNRESSPDS